MKYKILLFTLSEDPFNVMITGEKTIEYRKPKGTGWIESRLFNKDGSRRDYDLVKFINGYGGDKPYFTAIFNGFSIANKPYSKDYSNGLHVDVEKGDFEIYLGDITKKGNIK